MAQEKSRTPVRYRGAKTLSCLYFFRVFFTSEISNHRTRVTSGAEKQFESIRKPTTITIFRLSSASRSLCCPGIYSSVRINGISTTSLLIPSSRQETPYTYIYSYRESLVSFTTQAFVSWPLWRLNLHILRPSQHMLPINTARIVKPRREMLYISYLL